MGVERVPDGSSETTEELLAESRELLRSLTERLRSEDGAVTPTPDEHE